MGFGHKRADRIADLILQEISKMILNGEVKDPRVSTVVPTDVIVSDDLGFAKIYFTTLSDKDNKQEVLEGINKATPYIKRQLSQIIRIKRIPNLKFIYDDALEQGYKVDDLLKGSKIE